MVLVTGATGTVGRHVVAELVRAGAPARVLVRSAERGAPFAASGLDVAVGDLADPASLDGALDGVERMFLLTPISPALADVENGVIDAAKAAGVRHVVKLGARGAASESSARFTSLHGQVIEHLKASGIGWTIVMPGDFMQNFLNNAPSIARDGRWYRPYADARVASVDAADIGAVGAAAVQGGHEGAELELTGSESLSPRELAAKVSAILARDVQVVEVDEDAARTALAGVGMSEWLVEGMLELLHLYAQGAAAATTDTVSRVLGRPPRTWDEFLRDHADAFG